MNCFYLNTFYSVLKRFYVFIWLTIFILILIIIVMIIFVIIIFVIVVVIITSSFSMLLAFIFLGFTILFYLCIYRIFLNFKQMTKMGKTLFKVGIKDTEVLSVSLMGTLNTVCLTSSSDDLLFKWHCYILPLTIISFIL